MSLTPAMKEDNGRDENGFTLISEGEALGRIEKRLGEWAERGGPDRYMIAVHLGDLRRLWEASGRVLPEVASLGLPKL